MFVATTQGQSTETLQSVTERGEVTDRNIFLLGTSNGLRLQYGAGSSFWVNTPSVGYLALGGRGTAAPAMGAMNIVSNGNVGIGTATPTAKLTLGNVDVIGEIGRIGFDISVYQRAYIAAYRHTAVGQLTDLYFGTMGAERMRITSSGNVGIGTITPAAKLTVEGGVLATKVKVSQTLTWPDYVFEPAYQLTPLGELEQYISENKHLPGIPSAAEVAENGLDLGDNQAALLEKIEELTLHLIRQQKEIDELKKWKKEHDDH